MNKQGREMQHRRPVVLPEAELKYQPGVRIMLPPGHELWEATSAHLLRGRLSKAVLHREVEVASDWRESKAGAAAVVVKRLRQPASKAPWYIAAVTALMGAAVGIGVLLWHSRWVILCGLAVAAIVVLVLSRVNHGGACAGLHCAGCKG